MKAAVFHRELVVRQAEIAFQPFEEGRFKNSTAAIEGVTGEPDQFRPAEADASRVIELLDEFFMGEGVDGTAGRAIEKRELHMRFRETLPDKLQHQQLIEISVEQRAGDRVEFPVVIVRPLREVHDHALISSYAVATKANGDPDDRHGSSGEFELQGALEISRETLGFLFDSDTLGLGEFAEWLDIYQQLLALKFVRPNARDRAIDQYYRRDPALIAVDALIVLCAQQVIFFAMSEQIGIEIRKQAN